MTTPALVRAAWDAAVFQHATIQAITPRIYDYDISASSAIEDQQYYHNQEINFLIYAVTISERLRLMNQIEQVVAVDVRYFREIEPTGANYKAALDIHQTIHTLVRSELGSSWDDTVDYYRTQTGTPTIAEVVVDGRPCWRSVYRYDGTKNI